MLKVGEIFMLTIYKHKKDYKIRGWPGYIRATLSNHFNRYLSCKTGQLVRLPALKPDFKFVNHQVKSRYKNQRKERRET